MSYNPLDNYWKDFFYKRIEWYRDYLREHPGNARAIQEIKESKEMLYKKFLIIVDTPELEPAPKTEPVQLALPF